MSSISGDIPLCGGGSDSNKISIFISTKDYKAKTKFLQYLSKSCTVEDIDYGGDKPEKPYFYLTSVTDTPGLSKYIEPICRHFGVDVNCKEIIEMLNNNYFKSFPDDEQPGYIYKIVATCYDKMLTKKAISDFIDFYDDGVPLDDRTPKLEDEKVPPKSEITKPDDEKKTFKYEKPKFIHDDPPVKDITKIKMLFHLMKYGLSVGYISTRDEFCRKLLSFHRDEYLIRNGHPLFENRDQMFMAVYNKYQFEYWKESMTSHLTSVYPWDVVDTNYFRSFPATAPSVDHCNMFVLCYDFTVDDYDIAIIINKFLNEWGLPTEILQTPSISSATSNYFLEWSKEVIALGYTIIYFRERIQKFAETDDRIRLMSIYQEMCGNGSEKRKKTKIDNLMGKKHILQIPSGPERIRAMTDSFISAVDSIYTRDDIDYLRSKISFTKKGIPTDDMMSRLPFEVIKVPVNRTVPKPAMVYNKYYICNEEATAKPLLEKFKASLLLHQKYILGKMIETEYYNGQSPNIGKTTIPSTAILCDPFGSGKTIEVLSLICYSKKPKINKEYRRSPFPGSYLLQQHSRVDDTFWERFVRKSDILPTNLLIVGSAVYHQWLDEIRKFTDLTVFSIENIFGLRTFQYILKNNPSELKKYDVVLVRNSTSVPLDCSYQPPELTRNTLLANLWCLTHNKVWYRVLVDDFDTINLKFIQCSFQGLFTWMVSATNKQPRLTKLSRYRYNCSPLFVGYGWTHQLTKRELSRHHSCDKTCLECNRKDITRVRTPELLFKESRTDFKSFFYQIRAQSSSEEIISSIADLGIRDDVLEMLHSGAMESAAASVGATSGNIIDIFKAILKTQAVDYRRLVTKKERIEYFLSKYDKHEDKLFDPLKQEPEHYDITIKNIEYHCLKKIPIGVLQERYRATLPDEESDDEIDDFIGFDDLELVEYDGADIDDTAEEVIRSMTYDAYQYANDKLLHIADDLSKQFQKIERIRERLTKDDCPICLDAPKNPIVFSCCQIVLCASCMASCCKSTVDRKCQCPICRTVSDISSFLFVGDVTPEDINVLNDQKALAKALTDGLSSSDKVAVTAIPDDIKLDIDGDPLPEFIEKDYLLLKLLQNKTIPTERKTDITDIRTSYIPQMIKGTVLRDRPENRKFLLFSNHVESLEKAKTALSDGNVKHLTFAGTGRQLARIRKRFKRSKRYNVLLVNSLKHCAGVNFEFVTDIVFLHKILNPSVEAQIIGRAVRIGRTCNLHTHYLLYQTESIT